MQKKKKRRRNITKEQSKVKHGGRSWLVYLDRAPISKYTWLLVATFQHLNCCIIVNYRALSKENMAEVDHWLEQLSQ